MAEDGDDAVSYFLGSRLPGPAEPSRNSSGAIAIGAAIGRFRDGSFGALIGGVSGMVLGVLLSGAVLMVIGLVRKS